MCIRDSISSATPVASQEMPVASQETCAVNRVVEDLIAVNPGLTEESVRAKLTLEPGGAIKVWNLSKCGLTALPESFGTVRTTGDLWLCENQLTELPESFGSVVVAGMLLLQDNRLRVLPASFGSVTVGKELWLHDNQLEAAKIPAEFPNICGQVSR
eukprot:TRINITY_DN6253_c0_g1_i1.p1 TRINITY_DN6253_c0_g1~~TRINITY_DN6253_c0_g1_i1.p1  ORF type:complete len:157 (+),score=32.35 TRINITY_DN6253_c0_g1_i1:57-527(+)